MPSSSETKAIFLLLCRRRLETVPIRTFGTRRSAKQSVNSFFPLVKMLQRKAAVFAYKVGVTSNPVPEGCKCPLFPAVLLLSQYLGMGMAQNNGVKPLSELFFGKKAHFCDYPLLGADSHSPTQAGAGPRDGEEQRQGDYSLQ